MAPGSLSQLCARLVVDLAVPVSLRKTAWQVLIYTILCIASWGLSLADWWGSGPHREVEDRPGVAFETVAPWDSSEASGALQGSAWESKPLTRKRGGFDPHAGAILPLQQGIWIDSVGGLIPASCGVLGCLFLFWALRKRVQRVYYRLSAETQICEEFGFYKPRSPM